MHKYHCVQEMYVKSGVIIGYIIKKIKITMNRKMPFYSSISKHQNQMWLATRKNNQTLM